MSICFPWTTPYGYKPLPSILVTSPSQPLTSTTPLPAERLSTSPAVVASCTSLTSLELCNCGTPFIKDVIAACGARLLVFETELASGWNVRKTVPELAAVLELPAMRKLKRWRMGNSDAAGNFLEKQDIAEWEDACRARGVEPRDDRRFFTG